MVLQENLLDPETHSWGEFPTSNQQRPLAFFGNSNDNQSTGVVYYYNEMKLPILQIPVYRALSTVVMIYILIEGGLFIRDLCTMGTKFIFSISLIACVAHMAWAIWYDKVYVQPPTWTFMKEQKYWAVTTFCIILYQTMLVAVCFFVMAGAFVLTFADYSKVFDWECRNGS